MTYALRYLYFSAIATTVLLLGSCDDEMEEITNSRPTIDRVIVPQEVKAGEKVKLEVVANDADGDKLTYKWEVSEGTVDAAGVWTVPSDATRATVLVRVGDGINSAVASSKISVEIVAPPDPSKPIVPKGMVSIPAGEFQMGSNNPEAQDDEQPVHTVYVNAFFMDEHEVTNLEYQKFLLANPHWQRNQIDSEFHDGEYLKLWSGKRGSEKPKGKADHPVVYVSWYAAMAYAGWVGKRLPRRRSGSMPRGVGCRVTSIPGARVKRTPGTKSGAMSLITVRRTTAILLGIRRRWVSIRRTITVCMTWRAMCGSGVLMSTIRISILCLRVRIPFPVRTA